jgi:hypothetical protein
MEGGDADNAPADNENPPAEEKKEEKPAEKPAEAPAAAPVAAAPEEKAEDDDDPFAENIMEPCCCCECVCANEFTKDSSCCGCFPIKCGAVTIGLITVIITTILFVWYFFLFLNEYIHWWYVLVCLFLLCPILVGSSFIITWFTSDTKTTRAMLYTSQILALCSVFLLAVWNLIYFVWLYKKDKFYAGMGDIPTNVYTSQSKKNFLFTMLFETVLMLVMFSYFLCVTAAYADDMHGPPKEEEAAVVPVAEKKPPSEKSSKSQASKKSEKKEDAPAEDPPAAE